MFHFVRFGQLIHLQLCWFNSLVQGSWILIILKNHSNIAHFRANCRPQEKCQNLPWRTKKCKKKTDLRLFFDFLQKKRSYLEVGAISKVASVVHLRFFPDFDSMIFRFLNLLQNDQGHFNWRRIFWLLFLQFLSC